ncbi:E3 ubiquitin-protein ligase rififylin isoform X2 [Artibeus jamaicensis]|nr:E3 ubiquitin-protein ligase rififylin isoform X2 [Artibeus jamaicensis]XP_037023141.2 E3 ubiquitin-protein ligase rififylin isoform X2 [Artibeus jamaicensis]XP_037023142.2 E3 ubiquitin-protein ligase rififylin isoform X2 [Artibeus jamaicensis]XP_037023143.2 E3 ubiquitin-protein ligase rififylin isoform X2 [Artibeus jamaicensis]XP_037023144.2 E3 ubiquitin-protein ligase rififylin isoform X2 [Artibeus jamaicensis]XP_037023145.2 E3 ubiquitin-protein ligase rififylin isoform X2 [Artibeus jamaic
MWATCCNWFCLDGQPEEAPPSQGARAQAYSNPGYSSFPSPTGAEPSCKACGAHFANMARKQTCLDCKKNFCATCSSQVGTGPRLCLLCQRFQATAFQREELMKMKVKDLRDYLNLHDISTETCREKEELVFLVLGQQPVTPQEGRTRAPASPGDFPEQQAFLGQPRSSAGPPTSPGLPSPPTQAAPAPAAQAQEHRQASGHVSQDQGEPVYLESAARAPAEDETQSVDSEDSSVPGRRASLSDLTDLEDIEGLTVRQLKEILARNFVNYKGCCEKWELMERVTRLYKDQKGLQHLVCGAEDQNGGVAPPSLEENLCRICMDSPIDCVLLECGHMVTCTKCGKRMNECPICRQYVIRAVHVFRS